MSEAATRDVVIIGGGPTGLLLGCLLAARGLDILVLERRSTPGHRTRAIGVHAAALAVLDAAGIGARVRQEAAVVERGVALCEGRTLAALDLHADPVLTLPQYRTEALLTGRLASLTGPGAGLRRGEAAVGIAMRDECAEVATETADGRTGRHLARYVVGADGARSAVRSWIGAEWRRRTGGGRYAMADERAALPPLTTALLHLEPEGVVECIPLPAAGRRWVLRLEDPVPRLGRAEFAARIAARVGAGPDPAAIDEPARFTAAQHLARPYTRRVALLGDAAHELSPIGGQGMNLGWLDAAVLDRVLARALAEGAPERPFAEYERRRAAARRAMRRAALNTGLGAPVAGLRLRARNALVRMLAVPMLRPVARAVVTIRR